MAVPGTGVVRCSGCLRSSRDTTLSASQPPLAALRASLADGPQSEELVLMCPFCLVQMTRCVRFIHTARKCEQMLSGKQRSLHELKALIYDKDTSSQPRLDKYELYKINLPSVDQDSLLNHEQFTIIRPITKREIKVEFTEVIKSDYPFLNEDLNAEIESDERTDHITEMKAKQRKRKVSKTIQHFLDDDKLDIDQNDKIDKHAKLKFNKPNVRVDRLYEKTERKRTKTKHNLESQDREEDTVEIIYKNNKIRNSTPNPTGSDKNYKRRKKPKTKQVPLKRLRGKEMEQRVESMKFKILYLSEKQQLQEVEDRKRSEKYSKSPYKCEMCGSAFVIVQSFDNHMVKHSEERGAHSCDVCRLRFRTARQLQCHKRDHSRHFRCAACGETVRSYTDCDRHYARCAGYGGAVSCPHCGKQSENSYTLHKHILKIHRSVKRFTCDYCKKDFRQKVSLQNHMRKHTGERPFACQACGQRFAKYTCLKQHALVHNPTRSHYCVECDKTYRSYSALLQHLARSPQHRANRDAFKHPCPECGKRFFSPSELATHRNTAHVKSPLQCPHCPKVYYRKEILRKHVRSVHEGYVPPRAHPCDVCGKAFTEKFRLVNHTRTHTGARPFSCELCPASFAHKSAVWGHRRAKHAAAAPALARSGAR